MKKLFRGTALLVVMTGLIACGCSTLDSGPSDETPIAALLDQWE
ncbi:MAG: hypothetical protein WC655_26110 [Candidatus Hydrogenedentales bacterium]